MTDLTMGQRIAEERKKLALSQESLGEKMGVSRQAISKWEADGAVPEIDKLIQLSKLFGVSVGWLLGVEENRPETEAQDTLSEKQLQLIEEIVKKYPPKPPVSKFQLVLAAGIAALGVVAMTIMTLASMGIFDRTDNAAAIDSLRYEMNSQLAELDSRISSLSTTQAQTPVPALLADYQMKIASIANDDSPRAKITFSAVPNGWQEGDSASLSIRREGMQTVTVPCQWDGAFLTTEVTLEVEDGYAFCLTVIHGDGTQEQQVLQDSSVQNMKKTLNVTAEVTQGKWSYDYEKKILNLHDYECHIAMPTNGLYYGQMAWEQADLILMTTAGEELGRYSLLNSTAGSDILASTEIWFTQPEIQFINLYLPREKGIELWLCVETDNGLSAMEQVVTWATDSTGKIFTQ